MKTLYDMAHSLDETDSHKTGDGIPVMGVLKLTDPETGCLIAVGNNKFLNRGLTFVMEKFASLLVPADFGYIRDLERTVVGIRIGEGGVEPGVGAIVVNPAETGLAIELPYRTYNDSLSQVPTVEEAAIYFDSISAGGFTKYFSKKFTTVVWDLDYSIGKIGIVYSCDITDVDSGGSAISELGLVIGKQDIVSGAVSSTEVITRWTFPSGIPISNGAINAEYSVYVSNKVDGATCF